MLTSQSLRELRAGPVIRAGMVKDGTVRAWRANNGLRLGRETGNGESRRYELLDAARLTLMRFLTERLLMPAQAAANATNAAETHLMLLASYQLHLVDYPESPLTMDRYVMVFDRVDGSYLPEIFEETMLGEMDLGRIMAVTVRLSLLVEYARDNLISAVGYSPIDLRERLRVAQAALSEAKA